jgi:hypothetical protein
MAKLYKFHEKIGTGLAKIDSYPGRPYHQVEAVLSRRGNSYRCWLRETWGSNQGGDWLEEHGRSTVVGRGETLGSAVDRAKAAAEEVDFDDHLLVQAWSRAIDQAEDAIDAAEEAAGEAAGDAS